MTVRKQRKNLNKHTDVGTRLLGESIKRDGYIGAITVAADMETFDGSNRIEVGGKDFDDAVVVHTDGTKPVVVVRDDIPNTDDPKAQRLGFTANQIASADLAFDYKELADYLARDPIAAAIAKDDARIAAELAKVNPPKQETTGAGELIDKAAQLQEKWKVNRGDLWQCGKHLILCGDSTNADDVAKLDAGDAIGICDPPYGINVDTAWLSTLHVQRGKPRNKSDDKLQGDDGTLDTSCAFDFGKWLVWGFPYIKNEMATGWLVWDKNPGVENGTLGSPVELAQTNLWNGFRIVRVMWGGYYKAKGEKREPHPTQKPIGVIAPFIQQYTDSDAIVVDKFLGSGTTLVACEQTGRIGRGIEIEPKYVAVTLERLSLLGLTCERIASAQ